ncbi:polysaccharide biosynthesis C-terminal domain-containing protein [Candidatus Saganbacteria bacterium]|nr:polysaccharide biosynthesis C-terminal domain-containing protein [Candidatus Saganbacteria bacterium]
MKRSAELILGIVTSYILFGINFIVNLAMIPLMLHYLGNMRYGLWLTLLSVIGYIGIMDMGSTFTISKYTADTQGSDQNKKLSRLLSTALLIYFGLGLAVLSITIGLSFFIASGFSLSGILASEATVAFVMIGINLALTFIFNVFSGIIFGRKQVVAYNIFNALNILLGFAGTLITLKLGYGLIGVALALLAANVIVSVIRIFFVIKTLPGLSLSIREFEPTLLRQILFFGSMMFILGVGGQIIFNTDNIVIAKFLGLGLVASYAIAFRVNQVAVSFINKLADTFFPFYAELHALGDREKLRIYLFESSQFSAIISFFIFIFMAFWGKTMITLWLGHENFIGRPVFFLLALIVLMSSLVHLPAVVLQGMGKIKSVVGFNIAEAAINLGLSIVLAAQFGVFGVALGTVIAMAATSLWYVPYRACRETESSFSAYIVSTIILPACLSAITAGAIFIMEYAGIGSDPFMIALKAFLALIFYLFIFFCFGLSRKRKTFYFEKFRNFRNELLNREIEIDYE